MIAQTDLFEVFRWSLATVCTIYAIVVTLRSWVGWLLWFRESRETAILGRYTMVLMLRLRWRRFAGELLQIAGLSIVLLLLVYIHYLGRATP